MATFEEFVKRIERAGTIDLLSQIETEIRESDLSESEKKTLISIHIGRKRKELAGEKEIYESQVMATLKTLDVTDDLRGVLEDYWLVFAEHNYSSYTTLRKNVLPYIRDFVQFLRDRKGKTLEISDFDLTKLKSTTVLRFLTSRTKSEYVQRSIWSFINVFLTWLVREGHVDKVPYLKIKKPEKTPERKGQVRNVDQLEKIFTALSMPTPKVEKWRLPLFRYFGLVNLQCGQRPEHLLALRVMDLVDKVEHVEGVYGYEFVKIPFKDDVVLREKKRRGETISRKRPAEYIYIHKELRDELYNYCVNEMGWDDDDPVFPIPLRTLQRRAETVASTTGIKDFSLYDFRETWASVVYRASGNDINLVVDLGGWRAADVPVSTYIEVMAPQDAIEVIRKFRIFLPKELEETIERITEGRKVTVTPEDVEEERKRVEKLEKLVEQLMKRIEELEKKG